MSSKLHGKLKNLLQKTICYFKKPSSPWGIGGGVDVMMESRQQVRQKLKQQEQWKNRYGEIVRKHTK
jgi:hypothetical protein